MANMTSTFLVNRLVDQDAENHAKDAIMHHPGVQHVECDSTSNTIVVTYDSSQISTVRVEEAISRLGIMTVERHDKANV